MAAKRLLAVVIAVALVVGASVMRRFLDDGGGLSLGGGGSRIYCDSSLADACTSVFDSADLIIEAPGVTLERFLDTADQGAVVWIAADLWFDILESEQRRLGQGDEVTATSDPIAHSPLVLATDTGECSDISWACVMGIDGDLGTGGDLDSSAGLAVEVQLAVTALGRVSFATNDPDFRSWKSRLTVDVRPSRSELALLGTYLNSPGVVDAIALSDAAVTSLGRTTGAAIPTDGGADLEIEAVALNGARLPGSLGDLGDALTSVGWLPGSAPAAELPTGGAMQALRS